MRGVRLFYGAMTAATVLLGAELALGYPVSPERSDRADAGAAADDGRVRLAGGWAAQDSNPPFVTKDGKTRIPMPDFKTAEKVAKKFNREEERAAKRAERAEKREGKQVESDDGGFKAEDSGPCADPTSGVNC